MKALCKQLYLPIATLTSLYFGIGVGAATIIHVPNQGFVLSADGESGLVDIGGLERPLNFFGSQDGFGGTLMWRWEPAVLSFHELVADPDRGPSPMRIEIGMEVGGGLSWEQYSTNLSVLASPGAVFGGSFTDTQGFMAVRIYDEEFGWENEEALPYYGWIRLSHSDEDAALTVHDWAWNSTPGEPILAGQIPEPAAYALAFALGVLGFVIFRRRSRNGIV